MTNPNYSYLSQMGPWPLPVTVADTVNPGDLLYFDSGTLTHRPLTDPTKGNLFSGIALGEWPVSSNIDNGSLTPPAFVTTTPDGVHGAQFGTAGDVLTPGDALYQVTDSQTLTNQAPGGTDSGDVVGFFWPDDGAQITVVAGQQIQWRPRVNWPTPTLMQ